ncbi:MAG: DEAD/DEAH box helicase family protein [Chloroflexota bacterium]|nr:DEAD/DEAH box helicase family protein [Chloroflexota bacterium]
MERTASAATKRIFHDKVGIFTDAAGDRVGFRGTMNETFLGLAPDGNLESIDIFPSWAGGRDEERLRDAAERFESLWINEMLGVTVQPIPDQTMDELRRLARAGNWRTIAEELEAEAIRSASGPQHRIAESQGRRELRPHQLDAIAAWEANGRRGILEHATGSGKTTTALEVVRRRLLVDEPSLVVVPSELLLRQWTTEIETQLADVSPKVLKCGGGNREWANGLLHGWLRRPGAESRIAVAIINTAATPEFRDQLHGLSLNVVVDEVHRIGSPEFRQLLQVEPASQLGLSATPRRFGDPDGTQALMDWFDGVVHTYPLSQAIEDGILTPYTYSPHVVRLSASEQERWDQMTERIRRRSARLPRMDSGTSPLDDRTLRLMLIQRARIARGASGKVELAVSLLREQLTQGQRWLVYCDDRTQLEGVREALHRSGIDSLGYFDAMAGDHVLTIRDFELNSGVLVAINCLDEGVDIPACTHALVLASSRNPRQFLQRRGRILRRSPGKTVSHLYDAIVIPAEDGGDETTNSLVWGELARGVEFGRQAINTQSQGILERLASDLGLDVATLADLGFEEDPSEEG